jgi:hypothetical protein
MAVYSDALGYQRGEVAAFRDRGEDRMIYQAVKMDFAAIAAARTAASATALASGDTLKCLQVPANAVILAAGLNVVTAETTNTTATFSLGFQSGSPQNATYYGSAVASNAVANSSPSGLSPQLIGTTAATVDLLLNTAVPANAVVHVWALLGNVNPVN